MFYGGIYCIFAENVIQCKKMNTGGKYVLFQVREAGER